MSRIVWISIIAGLVCILCMQNCQLQKANKKAADISSLYKIEKNKVVQFVRDGKSYSQSNAAVIDAKNIKHVDNEDVKALTKQVGNLKRNLISYSKVSAITNSEFKAHLRDTMIYNRIESKPLQGGVIIGDSLSASIPTQQGKTFSYEDNYLKISGIIAEDSIFSKYSIRSPFQLYYYYQRPGYGLFKIFRKKIAIAEIKFENPNTKADTLYTIILTREKSVVRKIIGY